jgi:hypothetical protein
LSKGVIGVSIARQRNGKDRWEKKGCGEKEGNSGVGPQKELKFRRVVVNARDRPFGDK